MPWMQQYMWNLEGKKLRSWDCTRVQDLAVSKSGNLLIALSSDKKIRMYDLEGDGAECGLIEYKSAATAVTLSDDGSKLLVR